MKVSIVWNPKATEAIDSAYELLPDAGQKNLEQAIEKLSKALGEEPLRVGESRTNQRNRIAFEPPLTVFFQVEERLQTVRVFAAYIGRLRPS